MISGEVLDAMVASGCTAEQIASAVKAACAVEEKGKAERRERDKLRKRAERAALKSESSEMSIDVQRTDVDGAGQTRTSADTVSLSPVPLLSPTPPNNPLTPKPIQKNNSRAHRLPEDWKLSGPDVAYGLAKGLRQNEIEQLAERFSSWAWSAGGSNSKKVNWHQAWQGWVQRDGPKIIQARAGPLKITTAFQQRRQEAKEILDDLDHYARGGSIGRQENPEFLSGHSGERPEELRGGAGAGLVAISAAGRGSRG